MPTPKWDNLDVFVDLDDFAFTATRDDGGTFPVILEEQYLSRELGTYDVDYTVEVGNPWITARARDLVGLKKRTRLKIDGVQYWLTHDPQPDGTGMATAKLSRSDDR